MALEILFIAFIMAVITGMVIDQVMEVVDQRAAARITNAEQPVENARRKVEERLTGTLRRRLPGYLRQITSDLYRAGFSDPHWRERSVVTVLEHQLFFTLAVAMAA